MVIRSTDLKRFVSYSLSTIVRRNLKRVMPKLDYAKSVWKLEGHGWALKLYEAAADNFGTKFQEYTITLGLAGAMA